MMNARRLKRMILAVALMVVNAALPRQASGAVHSACDPAIPDPGADQVLTNLHPFEVEALYRTLRQMKSYYDYKNQHRPITDTLASAGQTMQTKNYVHTCTDLSSASSWDNNWICLADLTATFKLDNRWQDKLKGSGGGVTFTSDATGTIMQFTERVTYSWDAAAHWLTVYIRYPASVYPDIVNQQRIWGSYTMTAFSSTRVHSSSQQASGGLSISNPISLFAGAQKTESTSLTTVRADINGNPYWADTGIFRYIRDEGANSHFAVPMQWLTDADAHLTTTVTQNTGICGSMNQFKFDVQISGQGLNNAPLTQGEPMGPGNPFGGGAAIDFGESSSTSCQAFSEQFVASLDFAAENSFWENNQYPVGQDFSANVYAINLGGVGSCTCKRWYEVAFDAKVNWYLHFTAGSGDKPSFDLPGGNASPAPNTRYQTTFNCECI